MNLSPSLADVILRSVLDYYMEPSPFVEEMTMENAHARLESLGCAPEVTEEAPCLTLPFFKA